MEFDTSINAALSLQTTEIKQFMAEARKRLNEGKKIDYNNIWQHYELLKLPIFEKATTAFNVLLREQHDVIYKWDNQDKLALYLEARPSTTLLKRMASTLKAELGNGYDDYEFAYSAFIRSLHTLGTGSHGFVMSGRLSSLDSDKEVLKCLINIYKNLSLGEINIDNLLSILNQSAQYAIKVNTHQINAVQEMLVGQQMNNFIDKIHIFAYYYAVSFCTGTVGKLESQDVYLYPCHVDTMLTRDIKYYIYSEYISGKSLDHMLRMLTYPQIITILAILHSSLAYLWKKYRFTHGDLSSANVMLRIDPSGDPYDIPILDEDGNVKYYVRLPWHPVMIDLGMATTSKHSNWTPLGNPYTRPLNDIIRLYDSILQSHPYLKDKELFDHYLTIFKLVFTKEDMEPYPYPTPLGIDIQGLDHNSLLKIIEKSPEFKAFVVEKPVYNYTVDYEPIKEEKDVAKVEANEKKERKILTPQLELLSKVVDNISNFNNVVKGYVSVMSYSSIEE